MVSKRSALFLGTALIIWAGLGRDLSHGQVARFDSYQIQQIPANANIMLFPYFGDFAFFQSVGVRYIRSSGEGMDYLYGQGQSASASGAGGTGVASTRYGQVKKDGLDYPLVTQLSAHNYLMVSKHMTMDVSFAVTYRGFPNGTEDNTFDVEIIDPGFYAQMGSFTFGATRDGGLGLFNSINSDPYGGRRQSGFSANISMDVELTPYVRMRVYDKPSYRVDYVDARGNNDTLSGQRYPVFQNLLGLDFDWQMAEDKSLGYTFERTDSVPQSNEYDITSSVVHHQMVDYRQRVNPLTAVGLRSDTYWREYAESRSSQFQQDVLGYMNTDLTEDSSFNAALGFSYGQLKQDSAYETNSTSDAVIGRVGLQTRLTESLSHGISYSREQRAGFLTGFEVVDSIRYNIQWADPASWTVGFVTAYERITTRLANASSYDDWFNQLSASRPLTRDLVLTLATSYTLRMNGQARSGELGSDSLFITNDYDTWVSTVGLVQTLTDHLKLYAYVEHLERISPEQRLAGTRDTVGMTLGYYNDF